MMNGLTILGLAAAICLVGQAGLMVLQAWENRRFVSRRLGKPLPAALAPRTLLIAPCKGEELGLDENLSRLLTQDHGNFSVRFVVESDDDPAAAVIRRVMARTPRVPAELMVAGRATDGGQKVHNLRAATAGLPREVEVIAFVDSDARPRNDWLRALTSRAVQANAGAVTGYRWFVPERDTWPNRLLYCLNSGLAGLLGPGGHYLVWGGSWAIARERFERLNLRAAWRGTLSDDLVASRVLREAGARVEFEPRAMVASPIDVTAVQAWEFLVRQLRIARLYLPRWWAWLAISQATQAALLGVLLVAWVFQSRTRDRGWVGLSMGLALYLALSIWRGWLRQELLRVYGLGDPPVPRGWQVDTVHSQRGQGSHALAEPVPHELEPVPHELEPVPCQLERVQHGLARRALAAGRRWDVGLAAWSSWLLLPAVAASTWGRKLAWRGIRYRLRAGGQVTSLERLDARHEATAGPIRCDQVAARGRS